MTGIILTLLTSVAALALARAAFAARLPRRVPVRIARHDTSSAE